MTELEAGLGELAGALEALEIPYALIGGLAVSLWGEPWIETGWSVGPWYDAWSRPGRVESLPHPRRRASRGVSMRQTRVFAPQACGV